MRLGYLLGLFRCFSLCLFCGCAFRDFLSVVLCVAVCCGLLVVFALLFCFVFIMLYCLGFDFASGLTGLWSVYVCFVSFVVLIGWLVMVGFC